MNSTEGQRAWKRGRGRGRGGSSSRGRGGGRGGTSSSLSSQDVEQPAVFPKPFLHHRPVGQAQIDQLFSVRFKTIAQKKAEEVQLATERASRRPKKSRGKSNAQSKAQPSHSPVTVQSLHSTPLHSTGQAQSSYRPGTVQSQSQSRSSHSTLEVAFENPPDAAPV